MTPSTTAAPEATIRGPPTSPSTAMRRGTTTEEVTAEQTVQAIAA
jgi:hypothetical protein